MSRGSCIIYGGGGFIGSHLCEDLLNRGYSVTIFDKTNFSLKNLSNVIDDIKIIEGDFNNERDIERSLKHIDYVFHLVSSTLPSDSNENPLYDVETNLLSSLRLFNECRSNGIKKVIFISSGGTVYGIPEEIPVKESHPVNPIVSYGIIKRTIEKYLYMYYKLYGLDYYVFRLSNPYGERQNPFASQGAIAVFLYRIINNMPIEIWGDGSVTRDYIYIKDAVDLIAKSISRKTDEKIFNVSTAKGYSLNEIIEIIFKASGMKAIVHYAEGRGIDVPVSILDNTLAKETFDWDPTTNITDGIRRTYEFMFHNYKDNRDS
ncbi:MAG: NAD-dependent epimerase/dehydratase family protein [Ignavibacteriae bacterium]|nr:NAD-dependent epimerase/dehydratase family protein [Ignavibacteriota bacterium]